MMTYLVTGATGFVGAALTRRLLHDGLGNVRVLARSAQSAHVLAALGAQVCLGNLGDPNTIADAARGVDVLFHCAGESSHRAAASALSWIHVAGTENVINAARHAGVKRVVVVSCTDVTLVNRERMTVKEKQSVSETPLDAWARTKLLAEELALQASDAELEVCVLRPAWVWGPGDRHTLPALCAEANGGGVSLCGSGKNLVATVYVDNLVDALLLASRADKAPGNAYHVLDGELQSARELLSQLCASLSLPPPRASTYWLAYAAAWWRERSGAPGLCRADVVQRGRSALFDSTAAVRDLGYQPKTSVETGMRVLATWVREQGGADAIARTARTPASQADAQHFIALAEGPHSERARPV